MAKLSGALLAEREKDSADLTAAIKRAAEGSYGRHSRTAERLRAAAEALAQATQQGTPGFGKPGTATLPDTPRYQHPDALRTRVASLSVGKTGVTGGYVTGSDGSLDPNLPDKREWSEMLRQYTSLLAAMVEVYRDECAALICDFTEVGAYFVRTGDTAKAVICERQIRKLRSMQRDDHR